MSKSNSYVDNNKIKAYLAGSLSEPERYAFERQMEADPFLYDAVEGLSNLTPEELARDLDLLRIEATSRPNRAWFRVAAVISITIAAIVSFFVYWPQTPIEVADISGEATTVEVLDSTSTIPEQEESTSSASELALNPSPAIADQTSNLQEPDQDYVSTLQRISINTPKTTNVPKDILVEQDDSAMMIAFDQEAEEESIGDALSKGNSPKSAFQSPRATSAAGQGVRVLSRKESVAVESVPVGGFAAFEKYLMDSLRQNHSAASETILLEFSIDQEGNPTKIEVREGQNKENIAEAIRLLQEGPPWVAESSSRVNVRIPINN